MPTYREHQQLVELISELANLLEHRSRQFGRDGRTPAPRGDVPEDSPLHATWDQLGLAFQSLVAHTQSVDRELQRLGALPAGHD